VFTKIRHNILITIINTNPTNHIPILAAPLTVIKADGINKKTPLTFHQYSAAA